jgi:hypothetical protein
MPVTSSLGRRRLEDLPSDGGKVVDTLAGALLRVFVRLETIEEGYAKLSRRLAVLEEGHEPVTRPAAADRPDVAVQQTPTPRGAYGPRFPAK